MDRIQSQFTRFTQLLFDPKTAAAYQTVLTVTWNLIKEASLLIWLVLCSVFVLGAWIGENAISTGRNLRTWVATQSDSEGDSSEKIAATGQALLDISQNGVNSLLDQARVQLGLDKLDRPAKAVKTPDSKPAPTPVAAAPKPSAPAPTPTPASTVSESVAESSEESESA